MRLLTTKPKMHEMDVFPLNCRKTQYRELNEPSGQPIYNLRQHCLAARD